MTQPPAAASADAELRKGTLYGVAAYAIWGTFPLYFHALKPSGPWEILAHRIVWTLVFCGLILTIRRDWGWMRTTLRNPRLLGGLTVAALVIAVNWVVYILAVVSGRTYEAALGYFLKFQGALSREVYQFVVLNVARRCGDLDLRDAEVPVRQALVAVGDLEDRLLGEGLARAHPADGDVHVRRDARETQEPKDNQPA